MCEDYINPIYLKQELSKCILRAMRFIHELSDDKLKDKEVGCVSDLLKAIKTLLVRCSLRELVTTVDNLRLDTTIRMLNIPHFNAKMNALKEVVRLTEEPFQVSFSLAPKLGTNIIIIIIMDVDMRCMPLYSKMITHLFTYLASSEYLHIIIHFF